MKVKELIEKVTEYKEQWSTLDFLEACIRADFHPNVNKVAEALNPYSINFGYTIMATDVYKCDDGYVGVHAAFASYGDFSTGRHPVRVEEFVEYPSVSYRPKQ